MASIARRITAWREGEIRRTIRKSRRLIRSDSADVSVVKSQGICRVLIIIPKKVGTAVVRNRIRRRIRSLFFENKIFSQGLSWIIYVKPSLASLSFSELHNLFMSWASEASKTCASGQSSSSDHSSGQLASADSLQAVQPTHKP